MPKYRITGPDGGIYEVAAPEGASEAEIIAYVQKSIPSGATEPQPQDSTFSNVTGALARGITLGASDYAGAAGGALGGALGNILTGKPADIGGEYKSTLAERRKEKASFEKKSPVTAGVAELIGGLALPLPIPRATSLMGKVGESALTGAGVGGLSGAIRSEGDLGERAEGALRGAATGGALGAAVPVVAAGAGAALSPFINRARAPEKTAAGRMGEILQQAEMTPQQAGAAYRKLGPQGMLLDVAPMTTAEAERVVASGGKAGTGLETTLKQRGAGRTGRVVESINKALKPDDYLATEEALIGTLRENAKSAYGEAYKAAPSLRSSRLDDLLDRPIAQQAMREAIDLAGIEGRKIGPIDATGTLRGISTEAVDDLKRGLDTLIEKETNEITGRLNKRGKLINDFKNKILEEVDALNPAYAKAREQYAGDLEVLNALRAGRDVMKAEPSTLARDISRMSSSEKDAYRTGAAQAIMNMVKSTPDNADAARKIVGSPILRERLAPMFDKVSEYRKFVQTLLSERQMAAAENRITAGSQTARRLSALTDANKERVADVAASATKGTVPFMASAYRNMRDWASGISPQVNQEMARILSSRDPKEVLKALIESELAPQTVRAQQLKMAAMRNPAVASLSQLLTGQIVPQEETSKLMARR